MRALRGWRRHSATGLVLLGWASVLPAQSSPGSSSGSSTYQVSTHLVQFGVAAQSQSGSAEKLTKDDFVVLDRGKPQKISIPGR